jgi:hypothetical protein
MRTEDGGPLRAGSRLLMTVDAFGRQATRVSEMVVYEPPHHQAIRSVDQPTVRGTFDFILEPHPRGTAITFTGDLVPQGIVSWLLFPLTARGERRARSEMLGNLKRLVESTP